jgi:hypothetical protein
VRFCFVVLLAKGVDEAFGVGGSVPAAGDEEDGWAVVRRRH